MFYREDSKINEYSTSVDKAIVDLDQSLSSVVGTESDESSFLKQTEKDR